MLIYLLEYITFEYIAFVSLSKYLFIYGDRKSKETTANGVHVVQDKMLC